MASPLVPYLSEYFYLDKLTIILYLYRSNLLSIYMLMLTQYLVADNNFFTSRVNKKFILSQDNNLINHIHQLLVQKLEETKVKRVIIFSSCSA